MTPARGVTELRRVQTDERIGSLIAPQQARERITAQQFEVVAMGEAEVCEDVDDCERPHEGSCHPNPPLREGDWVLVQPRSWIDSPTGTVFVSTDAILGRFQT